MFHLKCISEIKYGWKNLIGVIDFTIVGRDDCGKERGILLYPRMHVPRTLGRPFKKIFFEKFAK